MKQKTLFISLAIVAVVIVAGVIAVRQIWLAIHGAESLPGMVAAIPQAMQTPPPLTEGAADWPCWRGPNGDGKSLVTAIRTDWTGGLTRLWEVSFLCQGTHTSTWSAPVVQGNRLVVPGRDEENDLLLCLDSETGELIWVGWYPAHTATSHGPGSRATPYIDVDRVYSFGRGGDLACWRLLDGELLWRMNVEDAGGKSPTWGHSASPLVYEDKVFVQAGRQALAIAYEKLTGDIAWKSSPGEAGYAALTLFPGDEATGLLVFGASALACLNPADGAQLWSVPWKTSYGVNATTPAVAGTTIFITSGYGTGCEAVQVSDGSPAPLWRNKAIASHHSDPILIDGYIYGYSGQSSQNRGDFKCLDLATGTEQWSTNEIGWGTATYVDGYLLCLDIKGNLFLVDPDPAGFELVAQFPEAMPGVTHPAWTLPVVANGRLYLRYMQHLICYNLMPD